MESTNCTNLRMEPSPLMCVDFVELSNKVVNYCMTILCPLMALCSVQFMIYALWCVYMVGCGFQLGCGNHLVSGNIPLQG